MLMASTSGNKVVNIEMKEVNEAAQRMLLAQQLDPFCQSIMSYILLGQLPKDRTTARSIKYKARNYIVDDNGVLRKLVETMSTSTNDAPLVLPKSMWDDTLKHYHDSELSGHRKCLGLLKIMKERYYFEGMSSYIHGYIKTCMNCQLATKSNVVRSEMQSFSSGYFGILVQLDHMKGTRVTKNGNTHILMMIDKFTGYV